MLGFALRIAAIARRHIRYVQLSTCRNDWKDGIQPTVNELGLVPGELANCQFSVRSLRGTVSAWKIVDHNAQDVVARHIGNGRLKSLDIGDGITLLCCVSLPLPSHCISVQGIEAHIQTKDPMSATFRACSFKGLVMFAAAASISAR